MLSNEIKAEIEASAKKAGICMLVLHITEDEYITLPIKDVPGIIEIDVGSEPMSKILEQLKSFGQPDNQVDLLSNAQRLTIAGVQARQQGDYHTALMYYRFALAVACHYQEWEGIKSLSENIWVVRENLKDLLRVNVTPPYPDGPESARLTPFPLIAGDIISTGSTAQPAEKYAKPLSEQILNDSRVLFPEVKALADNLHSVDKKEEWLQVLQTLRQMADIADHVETRRSLLTELYSLAIDLQRYEIAFSALLEELAQVDLLDLFSASGIISDTEKSSIKDPDKIFLPFWNLYLTQRQNIGSMAESELLWRYSIVFRHMQSLRWRVTCAGGANGHRFSYIISSFLHPIGRDYVFLLMKAGDVDGAFNVTEQTHARSMVDWMARTHYTNRLVRDPRQFGSLNAVMPAGPTEIRQVSRNLDSPILYYLETHDGYEAWLQQTNGNLVVSHIKDPNHIIISVLKHLPYFSSMEDLIQRGGQRDFRISGNIDRSFETLNENLNKLYQALFPPEIRIALREEGDKLVIIPDSLLEYIPFCALRTEDDRYLIEKYELVYWPSVTAHLLTKTNEETRKTSPSSDVAVAHVMGNPNFSKPYNIWGREVELDSLPGTEQEALAVSDILGVSPLLGANATLDTLLDEKNVIPIVHLATHGVLISEDPEKSFIALSDGDKLSAQFLYQFDRGISTELVVMSACQTALGGEHPDSLIGLTNAFLIAGANTVVSTLWPIDDLRTVNLVTGFYQELKRGKNVAEALRISQLQILQDTELQHPYYWAAFKITGSSFNPLSAFVE